MDNASAIAVNHIFGAPVTLAISEPARAKTSPDSMSFSRSFFELSASTFEISAMIL